MRQSYSSIVVSCSGHVFPESFFTNCLKALFGEMTVRAVEEINAFRHGKDVSTRSGLVIEVAKRLRLTCLFVFPGC